MPKRGKDEPIEEEDLVNDEFDQEHKSGCKKRAHIMKSNDLNVCPTNGTHYDCTNVNISNETTTEKIANDLKEFLHKEKIKHEIFSKSILNCSKSTLARMLNEPKTWETINEMWKLHFKAIYLWLNDRKRLDKLYYSKKLPFASEESDNIIETFKKK